MKQFTFSIIVLAITSLFIACKKEKAEESNSPTGLVGIWIGEYDYYEYNDSYYYSFEIKADGTIKEISYYGEVSGEGTWSLTGNTFTATYKSTGAAGKIYSVQATYDAANKKLGGSWG